MSESKSENFITIYVIRSRDGKYLRSKGYNGYGECWVDAITNAKTWSKPGPAKAQVTWWSKNYPDYGTPDLVILHATIHEVISGSKSAIASLNKELKQSKYHLKSYSKELNDLDVAMSELSDKKSSVYADTVSRYNYKKLMVEHYSKQINDIMTKITTLEGQL